MRWWHAVIVAIGLVIGGALSGGVYNVQVYEAGGVYSVRGHEVVSVYRTNRLTGTVELAVPRRSTEWERVPMSP